MKFDARSLYYFSLKGPPNIKVLGVSCLETVETYEYDDVSVRLSMMSYLRQKSHHVREGIAIYLSQFNTVLYRGP